MGKFAMRLFFLWVSFFFPVLGWRWSWSWEYHHLNSTSCQDCGGKENWFCSLDLGVVPVANLTTRSRYQTGPSNYSLADACVLFKHDRPTVQYSQVLEELGDNAVFAFVGDSNCRFLFHAMLDYMGHADWLDDLHKRSKQEWSNKDFRHTVDHTYLCPAPFTDRRNATVAFFWNRFLTHSAFFTQRLWSRCYGHCDERDRDISLCDGSAEEGREQRWQCKGSLDEVQIPGEKEKRRFITISHGGAHDTIHVFKGDKIGMDDPVAWASATDKIDSFYRNLVNMPPRWGIPKADLSNGDRHCWRTRSQGGTDILVSPIHLRPAACNRCYATKDHQPGLDRILYLLYNRSQALGLVSSDNGNSSNAMLNDSDRAVRDGGSNNHGPLFDGWVDAYSITDGASGAPWTQGDGIHYPLIVYKVIVEKIMYQILNLKKA